MRILMLGDVVGRSGRDAIVNHVQRLRDEHQLDAVIVNGENAAAGRGITTKLAEEMLAAGVDCLTSGDHIWDQKDIIPYIAQTDALIRPLNFPEKVPGQGYRLITLTNGKKLLVVQLIGRVFMNNIVADCPFRAADTLLEKYVLGRTVDAIVVDFHAEATSEKVAMGRYLDGRVTAVVGTHTHVPTADAKVLNGGTGYQTDLGMCGDYESVIGVKDEEPLNRFLTGMPKGHFKPASGPASLNGVILLANDQGLVASIERFELLDSES